MLKGFLHRLISPRLARAVPGPYHAFTEEYDRIVRAEELNLVLGHLNVAEELALDEAWREFETGLLPWRTKNLIMASQVGTNLRATISAQSAGNIAISLLIDQSGSMRGQKMLFTAASADLAQECFASLGCSIEVLGFTTMSWHGGKPRREWLRRFRRADPGRLNELLHIIYRDGDDRRASAGAYSWRAMLRPDLPKENIDGEALLWAARRLRERRERRKILILVSDGAPVDDATLAANGPNYLWDHFVEVIEAIQSAGDIALGAVGVGYSMSRVPVRSVQAEDPTNLANVLLPFMAEILVSTDQARSS